MTKRQDTAAEEARKARAIEALRTRALGNFGQALFDATQEYEQTLQRLAGSGKGLISKSERESFDPDTEERLEFKGIRIADVKRIEAYSQASAIATFLSSAFLTGTRERFELQYDHAKTLTRLHSALRPRADSRDVQSAVELVFSIIVGIGEATASSACAPVNSSRD
jgi:hypothetical protein